MRVCDRCGNKPIASILQDQMDGRDIDLCKPCREDFDQWMQPPKPEPEQEKPKQGPGRPKKG